jgi:hypothetical protein
VPLDGATLGLAGAAQVFRIDCHTDYLRGGEVYKSTEDTRYGCTSLLPQEANAQDLLNLARGYWGIETKQHFRRDHTQREDHCRVRNTTAARNLSLMRSLAIFLFERQRSKRNAKKSLPDWQSKNHRDPNPAIRLLTSSVT